MRKSLFFLLAILLIGSTINPGFSAIVVPPSSNSSQPDPEKVNAAVAEFKSLRAKERKERVKEVKQQLRAFKAAKKAGQEPSTSTLLLVILAILLPPLAVYLYEGEITSHFWISLLLTLIFWIPGVVYALILILGNNS